MLDFSIGELGVIGAVALVVLGPERLPKVARTVGAWVGKAQRYVNQVKSDINREIELADLKRLQEEALSAARSVESSLRDAVGDVSTALGTSGTTSGGADDGAAIGGWRSHAFERRYKPGPSIDQLADEIARLKRQLALPNAAAPVSGRNKYGARSRVNRPRIRR